MSFQLVCPSCNAASSPSVGVCPYCKSVLSDHADGKEIPTLASLSKHYHAGRLSSALSLGTSMYKAKPELKADLMFVLLFTKVLLESEAPSSQIRSLLAEAHMAHPENIEISDYLELLEGKFLLKKGINDAGEIILKNLIRRSPNNIHAHFILGGHLFWSEAEMTAAIPHLEACVRLHPNFLRAWGCLGALYSKLGNSQLASHAFQKCVTLETNPKMKEFFSQQLKRAA